MIWATKIYKHVNKNLIFLCHQKTFMTCLEHFVFISFLQKLIFLNNFCNLSLNGKTNVHTLELLVLNTVLPFISCLMVSTSFALSNSVSCA